MPIPTQAELPPTAEFISIYEIDIVPSALEIEPGSEVIHLGSGFNSRAILAGSRVLKISKGRGSLDEAYEHKSVLEKEHALLERYEGDYMPETSFGIVPSFVKDRFRTVTTQEFIGGIGLRELVADPEADTSEVRELLRKVEHMYEETKSVPDLANIQNRFNIFKNSNLVIRPEDDNRPWLVDTNFGKAQRSKLLGGIWSREIAKGVQRGLSQLQAAE